MGWNGVLTPCAGLRAGRMRRKRGPEAGAKLAECAEPREARRPEGRANLEAGGAEVSGGSKAARSAASRRASEIREAKLSEYATLRTERKPANQANPEAETATCGERRTGRDLRREAKNRKARSVAQKKKFC